jgi:hypothetical protein
MTRVALALKALFKGGSLASPDLVTMAAAADTNPLGGRLDSEDASVDAVGGLMSGFSENTLLTAVFGAWDVTPGNKVLLAPVSCEPSEHLLRYGVTCVRDIMKWDTDDIKDFLHSLKMLPVLRFSLEKIVSTILARPFTFERERLPPPPAADPAVPKPGNYRTKLWGSEAGQQPAGPVQIQMQDVMAWKIPEALIKKHTTRMPCTQQLMTHKQSGLLASEVYNWFVARAGSAYPSKQHLDMWVMQLDQLAPLAPDAKGPRSWGKILLYRFGNGRRTLAQVRARWHHPARPALALPPSDHTCANHLSHSPR